MGTNETPFGSGQIYIFGQGRVQVTLTLPRRASIRILRFCADRLVSVDSKDEVMIWDLQQAKMIASYAPPGVLAALVTDPMLDWALIGLQNGMVIAYDLDRQKLAPLRLPNFWLEQYPRPRMLPIVSMQLHPRDIGQLLIGYTEGAVIYSFKQNAPLKFFRYEVPVGAPGGTADPGKTNAIRTPRLVHALWHPTGTFIVTAHDDESLVFWDPKDGRVVMARTLQDIKVDRPGTQARSFGSSSGTLSAKAPYAQIAWCAKENPDDTGLLIAGGLPIALDEQGLSFLELGPTPVYATSSWQALADHFEGKRQHILPTPRGAEVVDFCLIPRSSPHFAGAQDPIAVVCLLSSGEIITLSFPSGHPISPTNQLHPSLAFIHPFVTTISVAAVDRGRWLGMTEKRQQGPPILRGGVESIKPLRRYEARNIVLLANGDGTIRIWDAGHQDELENPKALQVDIARALGRFDEVDITSISMAVTTGEMCAGTRAGEVAIYRWGGNKSQGRDPPPRTPTRPGSITDISERSEPSLKEGLQPFVLYNMAQGAITAIKMSDVGFVGIGSESGHFSIIDLRGPAVIYTAAVRDFVKTEKRSSFIRRGNNDASKADWPVVIEFGVLTVDDDEYSSILCFVGTNAGHVASFKILPQPNGGYITQFVGSTACIGRVISICPIKQSGQQALATGQAVAGLREGQQTNGVLVIGM